jgi:hypothetical protein
MVRITLTNSWIGIGLTFLCLGTSGGCSCSDKVCQSPSSALGVVRLPQVPSLCGPCGGYRPTCWMAWSDCCPPCPPPEQAVSTPHGSAGDIRQGEDVRSPSKDMEVLPMPQEEPRPKVATPPEAEAPMPILETPAKSKQPLPTLDKPAKGKEPSPKLEQSPKAENPANKAKEPRSVVPAKPSTNYSGSRYSESANWEAAPLPERYVSSPDPEKWHAATASLPKYSLRIVDPDNGDGESSPASAASLAVLAPKKRGILPDVRQVVFRQEEHNSGNSQRGK